MKKITPYYSLFRFYALTLLILTVLCYLLLLHVFNNQRQQASVFLFKDIYSYLTKHIETNYSGSGFLLEDTDIHHVDAKGLTYRMVVVTPTNQTLIHTHRSEAQQDEILFTLPHWQHLESGNYNYVINRRELLGWMQLGEGYTAYIQILHPPWQLPWLSPWFWLPILSSLLLLITGMFLIVKYKVAWRHLINYANRFPITLSEPYTPLNTNDLNIGQEFLSLTNTLNRINQQLHHSHRRILSLSKRLRRFADYSPLPLLLVGKNGQITFFNRRFEQSFMTAFSEDMTYYLTDFFTGKDKSTQHLFSRLNDIKTSRVITVTSLESDQDYLMSLQPWSDKQGQIQGFFALLTDISQYIYELKEIDLKVQQQADKLVEFNQLWSILGHELRTPLSGIIGLLELMPTDNFSAEQEDTFGTLTQTSHAMLTMLNDMLDAAKMEAGKLQVVMERSDLLTLCHQVADLMTSNARKQGIELLLHIDPACPRYLETDIGRLRQALMNLMSNAIKFTREGYVALHVKWLKTDNPTLQRMFDEVAIKPSLNQPSQWLCFTIKDTGIGIDEADRTKLFSHFNQANDSISRQFGGTGLGLAISNNFAQFLGGFIHVHSVVGEGSEFSLCLPNPTHLHQPIYHFNSDLSHILLIAFCKQSFSSHALTELTQALNITSSIHTGVSDKSIQLLTDTDMSNYMPIFLIEEDLYSTPNISSIKNISCYQSARKILLSMTPKQNLPKERVNEYNSFLSKPLHVTDLIRELVKLAQDDSQTLNSNNTLSRVEKDYQQFMESLSINKSKVSDTLNKTEASGQVVEYYDIETSREHSSIILIAEDNPINQKVVSKILANLGYSYLIANTGKEALDLLDHHNIALILMDCRMPVMDGLETSRHIRDSQNPIPIVALTAGETDADRQACYDAGMNAFLTKPIRKDALADILTKFMIT